MIINIALPQCFWQLSKPFQEDQMFVPQVPRLGQAVVEGDARLVEYHLKLGLNPDNREHGRRITPFLEAHILGGKDVLLVMSKYKENELSAPSDDIIITVYHVNPRDFSSYSFTSAIYSK